MAGFPTLSSDLVFGVDWGMRLPRAKDNSLVYDWAGEWHTGDKTPFVHFPCQKKRILLFFPKNSPGFVKNVWKRYSATKSNSKRRLFLWVTNKAWMVICWKIVWKAMRSNFSLVFPAVGKLTQTPLLNKHTTPPRIWRLWLVPSSLPQDFHLANKRNK